MFNEKYKENSTDITHIEPHRKPQKKKFALNFSKNKKRVLYNHEEIEVEMDIEYNHFSSYEILIS